VRSATKNVLTRLPKKSLLLNFCVFLHCTLAFQDVSFLSDALSEQYFDTCSKHNILQSATALNPPHTHKMSALYRLRLIHVHEVHWFVSCSTHNHIQGSLFPSFQEPVEISIAFYVDCKHT